MSDKVTTADAGAFSEQLESVSPAEVDRRPNPLQAVDSTMSPADSHSLTATKMKATPDSCNKYESYAGAFSEGALPRPTEHWREQFRRRKENGGCDCPYCRGDFNELAEYAANMELEWDAAVRRAEQAEAKLAALPPATPAEPPQETQDQKRWRWLTGKLKAARIPAGTSDTNERERIEDRAYALVQRWMAEVDSNIAFDAIERAAEPPMRDETPNG